MTLIVMHAHLDEESDIMRRKAVSQYALNEELDDLQVNKDLESLGEVCPR